MNENTKKALSQKNGKTNELYVMEVRNAVGKEYKKEDEIAILRKAVDYLFTLISRLHSGEINNEEFAEYNARIEQLKRDIKTKYPIENTDKKGEVLS